MSETIYYRFRDGTTLPSNEALKSNKIIEEFKYYNKTNYVSQEEINNNHKKSKEILIAMAKKNGVTINSFNRKKK